MSGPLVDRRTLLAGGTAVAAAAAPPTRVGARPVQRTAPRTTSSQPLITPAVLTLLPLQERND
jgi:hypothetical protein